MILTGNEIKKQVKLKRIHIKPFLKKNINPNSYNYRLGLELLEVVDEVICPRRKTKFKRILLNKDGCVLYPGRLYLGHTYEEIGSNFYVTTLIGRSSVGRLGLFLQITADLGHMKSKHCWTLELYVVQPLRVYPLMKIGQVCFWEILGKTNLNSRSKYNKFSKPKTSEFYKEFYDINRK